MQLLLKICVLIFIKKILFNIWYSLTNQLFPRKGPELGLKKPRWAPSSCFIIEENAKGWRSPSITNLKLVRTQSSSKMSASDQMRAMLDQLMGTARNGEYFVIFFEAFEAIFFFANFPNFPGSGAFLSRYSFFFVANKDRKTLRWMKEAV